jgi:hypothetical protein
MADWDGSEPTLLASPGGLLAIAVFGTATFGDLKVGGDGPLCLSLIRIGADGKLGTVRCMAPALAWAHPLALLDDGGLVIDGKKMDGSLDLMRVRPDGAIAWEQSLPADKFVVTATANGAVDTVGIVLRAGLRGVDAKKTVTNLKPDGPRPSEEVRIYDGGKLRFSSLTESSDRTGIRSLALTTSGGVIAVGDFTADLRIHGSGGVSKAIATHREGTSWIAAWDAAGRVAWLRELAMSTNELWVTEARVLGDGTIRVLGDGRRRLVDIGDAAVVDMDTPDAGAADGRDAGDSRGNVRRFVAHFDAATGVPVSVRYQPMSTMLMSWGEGTLATHLSQRGGDEPAYNTELTATDGIGQTRWRTDLGAHLEAVVTAPDAVLVDGKYNLVVTVPGREPPAYLLGNGSNRHFIGLLSWRAGPLAAPPQPDARFTELHDRAMRAFRAKRFRQACDLFVGAQRVRPADAANMADLALCLQRAGDNDGAVRANRYALRLASVPGAPEDKSLRVRKAAYYNLSRLDFRERGSDGVIESDFGCKRPVYVESRTGTAGGVRYMNDFTVDRYALDSATATMTEHEYRIDWAEIGASELSANDQAGDVVYDVTTDLQRDFRDEDGDSQDGSRASCVLLNADGCSGHLGFACEFEDNGDSKPSTAIFELTLKPAPPLK